MLTVLRTVFRSSVRLLLVLAGCGAVGCDQMMYGPGPVDLDPDVQIADFTYTPSGAVHAGDKLTFTATLSEPDNQALMQVTIGNGEHPVAGSLSASQCLILLDDGVAPDAVVGDGSFSGEFTWPESLPPQSGLPVQAFYHDRVKDGAPLTVLPAEED